MTYADSIERASLISGLRDLADYLESNQGVPAPKYTTTIHVFPPDGSDSECRAEVDAIASLLFTRAQVTSGGHYVVSRFFGPIEYRAVAIPKETPGDSERDPK